MPKPRRLISTVWANLRGWLRGAGSNDPGASDPGLQEAEAARRFAERTPPAPRGRILGGIDEPGLKPLRLGERTQGLVIQTPAGPVVSLAPMFPRSLKSARQMRDRFRCTSRELMN